MNKYETNETMRLLGGADITALADPGQYETRLKEVIQGNGFQVSGALYDLVMDAFLLGRLAERKTGAENR